MIDAGIRQDADFDAWLEMRSDLWPHCPTEKHVAEMAEIRRGSDFSGEFLRSAVLLVRDECDMPAGFAELTLRARLEGFATAPVAYLEGWYVRPALRGRGFGRALMAGAEAWAHAQGCAEIASDTEPDNAYSLQLHKRLGFSEYGLSEEGILLRKILRPSP